MHRHRYRAAVLLAATLSSLTACTGTDEAGTAPPPASSASDVAAAPDFDQTALAVLDEVVREDCTAVHARFDDAMSNELSARKLCDAWYAYQDEFGAYRSHATPEPATRGELTVVSVPLQMARRDGEFRVTFHPDDRIAGLYFLRTGVPIPPG